MDTYSGHTVESASVTLHLLLPASLMDQLQALARTRQCPLETVLYDALTNEVTTHLPTSESTRTANLTHPDEIAIEAVTPEPRRMDSSTSNPDHAWLVEGDLERPKSICETLNCRQWAGIILALIVLPLIVLVMIFGIGF